MYKRRNAVGQLLRGLKGFHRIFSRFEKLDVMFLCFLSCALIADGLRLCQHFLTFCTVVLVPIQRPVDGAVC
jgi:hypothetical protein